MQRKRGRGRRSGGNNNNPNRHYESTGPDVKIRGSAQQILDKYLQYARDALTAGDRVKAEAHFQHAEHYARIVATFQKDNKQRNKSDDNNNSYDDDDGDNDDNSGDNRSDDNNSRDIDQGTSAGQNKSGDNDNTDSKKPRGRSRKPRENNDDPMRVIDDNAGSKDDSGTSSDDTAAASSGEDEKPKLRRRTYRKKSAEADGSAETEGVMSTLARGRSDDSPDDDGENKKKRDSHTEAAE